MTIKECAERGEIKTGNILTAIHSGALLATKRGSRYEISEADFLAWFKDFQETWVYRRRMKRNRAKARRLELRQSAATGGELAAQRQAQEQALQRAQADGDEEAAGIIARSLAQTVAQIEAT